MTCPYFLCIDWKPKRCANNYKKQRMKQISCDNTIATMNSKHENLRLLYALTYKLHFHQEKIRIRSTVLIAHLRKTGFTELSPIVLHSPLSTSILHYNKVFETFTSYFLLLNIYKSPKSQVVKMKSNLLFSIFCIDIYKTSSMRRMKWCHFTKFTYLTKY